MPVIKYFEDNNKLIRINGNQEKEQVFTDMKLAVIPYIKNELKILNDFMLKCICNKDWRGYRELCDPNLTAFEDETKVCMVWMCVCVCGECL